MLDVKRDCAALGIKLVLAAQIYPHFATDKGASQSQPLLDLKAMLEALLAFLPWRFSSFFFAFDRGGHALVMQTCQCAQDVLGVKFRRPMVVVSRLGAKSTMVSSRLLTRLPS